MVFIVIIILLVVGMIGYLWNKREPKRNVNPVRSQFLFCPNCGTKVRVTTRFCPNCGYKLKNVNNVQSTSQVTPKEPFLKRTVHRLNQQSLFVKIVCVLFAAVFCWVVVAGTIDGYDYITMGPKRYHESLQREERSTADNFDIQSEHDILVKLRGKMGDDNSKEFKSFHVAGKHINIDLDRNSDKGDIQNAWNEICHMDREVKDVNKIPLNFVQNGKVIGTGHAGEYRINWN